MSKKVHILRPPAENFGEKRKILRPPEKKLPISILRGDININPVVPVLVVVTNIVHW